MKKHRRVAYLEMLCKRHFLRGLRKARAERRNINGRTFTEVTRIEKASTRGARSHHISRRSASKGSHLVPRKLNTYERLGNGKKGSLINTGAGGNRHTTLGREEASYGNIQLPWDI